MTPYLIPTAEPFFFRGGPVACLLVHGFTGTPKEMRWMGEYLAGQGHTVYGIRLPGHATHPEDMLRVRRRDWLACLEDGWRILNNATGSSQIFLAGLSMGGMLSLRFAAPPFSTRYPVAGVIAMSTPFALRQDWRLPFVKILQWIQPTIPKGTPDWRDESAGQDHIDYPYYPTGAVAELRDLLGEMRSALPQVKVPTLLIHSRQDLGGGSFDPHSMQKIFERLGSQDKQMLWVEDCGHVITREPAREQVFQAAAAFIQGVAQGSI
jgi:carboxylesterase